MNSGKFVVSFDMTMLTDGATAGNQAYLYLTKGATATHFMRWYADYLKTDDWGDGSLGNATEHVYGTWGHYDLVFNYDANEIQVYFNNVLWHSEPMIDVTGIRFTQMNSQFALDNFHARHLQKNIVTTDLTGTVATGTKTAYVSFKDAVDPATISADDFVVVNGDLDECEVTVTNKNWYGAELEFTDALTEGEYVLGIYNLEGIRGEALSQTEFAFTVGGNYEVRALSIVDKDGNALTDPAAWDKNVKYTVKADVENTSGNTESFWAVVAGFDGKRMTAVSFVEMQEIATSGEYSAELEAFDMAGATSMKLIALGSLSDLKPVMTSAVVIPGV